MKTNGGVVRDVMEDLVPAGNSPYALNRIVSKKMQASSNELGFTDIAQYPDMVAIGKIETDKEFSYLFLINRDAPLLNEAPTSCMIVKLGQQTNQVIIDDPRLAFPFNSVITGIHDYNYLGEEQIAWVADGINPSILNTDNLPFTLDANNAFQNDTDVELLKVFPNVSTCNINLTGVEDNGGALLSGAYIFFVSYLVEEGFESNKVQYSRPVYVYESSHTESFEQIEGSDGGEFTRKAINLGITDLDIKFKRLVLHCIYYNNGVQTGYRINDFGYTGTTKNIVVSDLSKAEEVPIESLLVEFPEFTSAKTSEISASRLHYANVKRKARDIGYDQLAKEISIGWVHEDPVALADWSGSHKDEVMIFDKQEFMADEVYAFYIGFKFKDGTRTKAYHIPGREAEEINPYPNLQIPPFQENALISDIIASNPIYASLLEEDGVIDPTVRYYHTRETARQDGTMGYWENQDEFYEDGVTKVRHHKFPSISALEVWGGYIGDSANPPTFDPGSPATGDYGQRVNSSKLGNVLGIKLSNIQIPDELKKDIESFEIFYAKRDLSNSTVIGQGYLQWVSGVDNNDERWETDSFTGLSNKGMFYCFDMLSERSNVSISFTKNYFRGDLLDDFMADPEFPDVSGPAFDIDPPSTLAITAISESQFVPGGANLRNHGHAEGFWQGPFHELTPTIGNPFGQGALSAVMAFKRNVYNQYEVQELVSTCIVFKITDEVVYEIPKLYRGDTFRCLFAPYASPARISSANSQICTGAADIRPVIVQSQKNIFLRTSNDTDERWNEKYFPKYDEPFLLLQPDFIDATTFLLVQDQVLVDYRLSALCWNYVFGNTSDNDTMDSYRQRAAAFLNDSYSYNKDFNILFSDKTPPIYHFNDVKEATHFPNLIARGTKKVQGEVYFSIRNFLVGDFYEMRRDRGEIVNIAEVNEEFFIQCESSLFKTVSQDTLSTEAVAVFLGTGDLFRAEPRELVTAQKGYIGNQNQIAVSKTKQGYIVVDTYMGKVFTVGQQLDEISAIGMRNWFRDNLRFWFQKEFPNAPINYDCSFADNGFGCTVLYDEENNRVLVSKVDYELRDRSLFLDMTYEELVANPDNVGYFVKDGLIYRWNDGKLEAVNFRTNPEFIDRSFTWSFSYDQNEWIGEHSYVLRMPVDNRNFIYDWEGDRYFQMNSGKPGRYFTNIANPFILDLYINGNPEVTKQLAGLKWTTRMYNFGTTEVINKQTLTAIAVYNDRQSSGIIALDRFENVDAVEQSWKFNKFRDLAINEEEAILNEDYSLNTANIDPDKPWERRRRFYGKHNVVRLIFNNNRAQEIYLLDVDATQRILS